VERRLKKSTEIEGSWDPCGVWGGSLMLAGVVHPTFRVCWNQAHIIHTTIYNWKTRRRLSASVGANLLKETT
jgi:hypothetical protein